MAWGCGRREYRDGCGEAGGDLLALHRFQRRGEPACGLQEFLQAHHGSCVVAAAGGAEHGVGRALRVLGLDDVSDEPLQRHLGGRHRAVGPVDVGVEDSGRDRSRQLLHGRVLVCVAAGDLPGLRKIRLAP
ncbi:hypothetical protein DMB38_34495 [Streptomyces sp. WAC 06738]|nr:hypothetical protein DMB38_34495 [Streptomyces sp. WAC 06738]